MKVRFKSGLELEQGVTKVFSVAMTTEFTFEGDLEASSRERDKRHMTATLADQTRVFSESEALKIIQAILDECESILSAKLLPDEILNHVVVFSQ